MLPRAIPRFEPPHRVLAEGTDAEPPAVAAYRRALPEGEVLAYPLDPLDHLGVPVWSAELFAARDAAHHHGVGFGASDARAAVGAFGELCEELFAGEGIKNLRSRRASYRELLSEVGADGVLDPLTACLPAGSSYTPGRPLRWVEARRWATHEPVLVPLELAASSQVDVEPEGEWLVMPVTNGLGAGPTLEHALAHGLLELVQRDGNSATYRALDRGVGVALDDVRSAETRALLDRLER
jgi:YcaO-like protein with predicted kinase domain